MTLGERILQKRKECGLSQESLGEKLEVTRQTVYKWESDQAVPELDKLMTLAQIFGVRVGWLIAEEESDQKEQAYVEAAQRIAALLAQSQAPQPVRSEPVAEAAKAPTGKKFNRFHCLVIAALVVILAVGAFKFASIDEKIADLKNTNLSSFSAGPEQDTQSIITETELTVYAIPSDEVLPKGTLPPGETVEILRTETVIDTRWGFILHRQADGTKFTGWINLDTMELEPAAEKATEASQSEQDTQVITTETELTVFHSPSMTSRLVGTLASGETMEILRTEIVGAHPWGFIQHQLSDGAELTGWIILDNTELGAAVMAAAEASGPELIPLRITMGGRLHVYDSPSITSQQVGILDSHETLEILQTKHAERHFWGYIQHQQADGTELTGWINLDNMEKNLTAGMFAVNPTE